MVVVVRPLSADLVGRSGSQALENRLAVAVVVVVIVVGRR